MVVKNSSGQLRDSGSAHGDTLPENYPTNVTGDYRLAALFVFAQSAAGIDTNDTKLRENDIPKIRGMCTLSVL